MVDMASIGAAVSSLKTATDITKTIIDISKSDEIQAKVAELNAEILSAQSSALAANADQFALLERVRELEGRIAQIESWETEKKRYQLTDFGGNTFAYVLIEDAKNGEPDHRICASCYQREKNRSYNLSM
jgi:hypothetical protein